MAQTTKFFPNKLKIWYYFLLVITSFILLVNKSKTDYNDDVFHRLNKNHHRLSDYILGELMKNAFYRSMDKARNELQDNGIPVSILPNKIEIFHSQNPFSAYDPTTDTLVIDCKRANSPIQIFGLLWISTWQNTFPRISSMFYGIEPRLYEGLCIFLASKFVKYTPIEKQDFDEVPGFHYDEITDKISDYFSTLPEDDLFKTIKEFTDINTEDRVAEENISKQCSKIMSSIH